MDENGLYLRLSTNWSIRLPSHLWHYSYCLCKTPALCKFGSTSFHTDLLIYICPTDLCHSACLGIICKNLRSLICKGKEVRTHYITSETFSLLSVFSKSPFASLHSHMSRGGSATIVAQKRVSHIRGADNSQNLHSVKAHHEFNSARKSACGTVRQN